METNKCHVNGCERCKDVVYSSSDKNLPQLASSEERQAYLHRCIFCNSYWELGLREAHVMNLDEVKKYYPDALNDAVPNKKCHCAEVKKQSEQNYHTSEEIHAASRYWIQVGICRLDMMFVYQCNVCGQLWGSQPAGHGWSIYIKLPLDYQFDRE